MFFLNLGGTILHPRRCRLSRDRATLGECDVGGAGRSAKFRSSSGALPAASTCPRVARCAENGNLILLSRSSTRHAVFTNAGADRLECGTAPACPGAPAIGAGTGDAGSPPSMSTHHRNRTSQSHGKLPAVSHRGARDIQRRQAVVTPVPPRQGSPAFASARYAATAGLRHQAGS